MPEEAYNADFPARQTAIAIIEKVIEPFILNASKVQETIHAQGIDGEDYYELEDALTAVVAGYDNE